VAPPYRGCAAVPGTEVFSRTSRDHLFSAYVDAIAGKRVALSLSWDLDDKTFDTTTVMEQPLFRGFETRINTQRVKPQVRVFLPIGFFASVSASYYDQQVFWFSDLTDPAGSAAVQKASFWMSAATIGWRLPRRIGSIAIDGTNLANKQFFFYEQALQENVIPARRVVLRADFTF
jgi:hypothetical protein